MYGFNSSSYEPIRYIAVLTSLLSFLLDMANVSFGSPFQHFSLAVGTRSPRTWVDSIKCPTMECADHGKRKYNSSCSTSHSSHGHAFSDVTEEWGTVRGYTSADHVELGELVVKDQSFGEVNQTTWEFGLAWFDGMLGLGLQSSPTDSQPSILQHLVDQGMLDRPLFSLYLANGNMTTDSELLLGGIDENLFTPPLHELSVSDEATNWEIQLGGLQLGDDVFKPDGAFPVVIDSMTTMIWLPSNIYAYL